MAHTHGGGGSGGNASGAGLDDLGQGSAGAAMIAGINVTPLVDVVLVLLVVLMVSSTYVVAQTLKVQLPKASTSDGPAKKSLKLVLLASGKLLLDDKPTSKAQAKARLATAIKRDPRRTLLISADAKVSHGRVVELIDLAKGAGVTQFAINVELSR